MSRATHSRISRIRARTLALHAELIRGWRHLSVDQRAEAERLIAAGDAVAVAAFVLKHQPRRAATAGG